jgi:hypothetical protein
MELVVEESGTLELLRTCGRGKVGCRPHLMSWDTQAATGLTARG